MVVIYWGHGDLDGLPMACKLADYSGIEADWRLIRMGGRCAAEMGRKGTVPGRTRLMEA